MVVAGDRDELARGAIGSKQAAGLVMKFGQHCAQNPCEFRSLAHVFDAQRRRAMADQLPGRLRLGTSGMVTISRRRGDVRHA
jgi:hypothetical protein